MTDKKPEAAIVGAVRDGLARQFLPTSEQLNAKAKFWIAFRQNPVVDERDVTPAMVEDLLGRPIQSWLAEPKFWEWWSERDTAGRQIQVAAEKAAELAVYYLDPSVPLNDNARIQLIKYVLEFSGRTPPSRREIRWADKEVAELSERELDELINKLSQKRLTTTT
jgi:hypothetical protein